MPNGAPGSPPRLFNIAYRCNESHRAAVGWCQMLLLATPRVTKLCRLANMT